MNERDLHRLFQGVVLASLPLACGGMTEHGGGDGGGDNGGPGGSPTAGAGSVSNASGASQGGTSAAGTSPGGSGAGSGPTGGAAGTGSGGVVGGGGTVSVACSGPVARCDGPRQLEIPRACLDPMQPLTYEQCLALCPAADGSCGHCSVVRHDSFTITIECDVWVGVGRRPAGFVANETRGTCRERTLGAALAHMAELEAVSIQAFRDLRRELASFGAPRALLRGLSRAGRDEIRHARRTRALARRFGGQVAATPRLPVPPRSLEALAQENMVEGCVRETFGALVAHFQSAHARDPELRGALARIARDETRHAALSWALHAWLERRLDGPARQRVRAAQRTAAEGLYAELAGLAAHDPGNLAGSPTPDVARTLFRQVSPTLWHSVGH